jgi:UPF0755 protein
MNDEWTDPFSADDPAAQAREQRRREREARRRAQLGERAQDAAKASEPAAPPAEAAPPPAEAAPPRSETPTPPSEPAAAGSEPPSPPSEPAPPPAVPPPAEPREPAPSTPRSQEPSEVASTSSPPQRQPLPPEAEPTREHAFDPDEEDSFIDEPLAEDSIDDDWPVAAAGGGWVGEPRPLPLPPDQALPRAPRSRTRRRRIIAAVVVFIVGLLIAFAVLLFQPFHGAGHGRLRVQIPRGSSASDIADLLDNRGVVANSTLFRIRLDLSGKSGEIQAGKYTLAHDMSYGDAIDALTRKPTPIKPKTVTVTIPEGYDRVQIASLLKKDGVRGSYLAESKSFKGFDPTKYGTQGRPANLEGFLFPATYKLKPKQDAKDLVGQQLAAFTQNIKQVPMGYARSKNLTTYDVVTIASVVQREAGDLKDFPKVAAVIYNRLRDGMPLQADATIRFAEHNYTKPLSTSDLHLASPYNSYEHTGLPPGPISNPGLAALKAAAHPPTVPYLYYVTKPGACGRLLFATTYDKALKQQARYHNARAAAGGKSPTTC